MPVTLKRKMLNVDEYHRMVVAEIIFEDEPVELLNGDIVYMSPVGNIHIGCVNRINMFFSSRLAGKVIVSIQNPIEAGEFSEPEPDVAICRLREDFYASSKASAEDILLVIEVSDSSLEKDREVKLPIYAKAGIQVCWIVNLRERQIEIYTNPEEEVYKKREIVKSKDRIYIQNLDFQCKVSDILG